MKAEKTIKCLAEDVVLVLRWLQLSGIAISFDASDKGRLFG